MIFYCMNWGKTMRNARSQKGIARRFWIGTIKFYRDPLKGQNWNQLSVTKFVILSMKWALERQYLGTPHPNPSFHYTYKKSHMHNLDNKNPVVCRYMDSNGFLCHSHHTKSYHLSESCLPPCLSLGFLDDQNRTICIMDKFARNAT